MARGKLHFSWDDRNLRRQFRKLGKIYKNKSKVRAIAKPAARVAVKFLRKNALVRGDTAKKTPPSYFKPKVRRRKGVEAVYYKGNARRSMRSFAFRKSYFMHVGAKVNSGAAAGGHFNTGYKTEGYYNHFLQYGTKRIRARRHMSKAIMQARQPVQDALRIEANKALVSNALATKR